MDEKAKMLSDLKDEIYENCDEDIVDYYGTYTFKFNDIDAYLDRIDNIYDKISLAQWANNMEKVEELVQKLDLEEAKQQKYLKLKEKNIEIDRTLNFKILDSKYNFLNDMLDYFTTDSAIQEQIISLSDEMLEVFKQIYNRLNDISDYNVPYFNNILRKIGTNIIVDTWTNSLNYYDDFNEKLSELIRNGYTLTDKELDTLIYMYNSDVKFFVKSMDDLRNFGQLGTNNQILMDKLVDEERVKEEKNINAIKIALLLKTYGIGLNKSEEIIKTFDIESLEITEENKDLFEMYKAIYQIVKENDPDILISIYDDFGKEMNPELDFMRVTTFENDLRKEFAKHLNKSVFKTEDRTPTIIDDIEVYDAGVDFKMIITAIGAYQVNFDDMANYSEYWNSPLISSHGNCCSLIGNNNLSMATVRNIILGFYSMSENMLLLSSNKDINSTPASREFDITESITGNVFTNADNLLDNTRGDYNELVYERRDLSSNPLFYKKNPDYIVFVEEYEDINVYLEKYKDDSYKIEYILHQQKEQERMWKETLKAAQNFGVPIVKINREKCAKAESEKINSMLEEFEQTKNPTLIEKIITQFENNRVGNCGGHDPIRGMYFSEQKIEKIQKRIHDVILNVDNLEERNILLSTYKNAIIVEQDKVKKAKGRRTKSQISGINFDKTLKTIENMEEQDNYSSDSLASGKKGK